LKHAGARTRSRVVIDYVDSEEIVTRGTDRLRDVDAILVPGGFGNRGIEGKISAICFARVNGIPYLGICLGMQLAVIEFARHVANLESANSSEFDPNTPHPVIALITEWMDENGVLETRSVDSDLGGTMRLGGQTCHLEKDSLVRRLYGRDSIVERHRHRYEFNNRYRETLESAGLTVVGTSADDRLVEIITLEDHPWFIGCQFHPEFTSTPRDGHPLFTDFILAAANYRRTASVKSRQNAVM